ncbi:helix-turn-helix domain-containing protein [Novosphingobium sp. MW5]|nr:helix-turn-helix domain-containing protein [Novosphingobium sp. MW5]
MIARPANSQAVYVLCKTADNRLKRQAPRAGMQDKTSLPEAAFWRGVDQAVQVLSRNYTRFDVDDRLVVPAHMIVPILEGFRSSLSVHETCSMDRRDVVLGQFYSLAKRDAFANVDEIARCLAMTRRNLHYYASSRLGIAPKKLIKSMALRNVMCQLPSSGPHSSSIADIAFEHGFESPAQFSMDYRKHFGERPSETRRRYQ